MSQPKGTLVEDHGVWQHRKIADTDGELVDFIWFPRSQNGFFGKVAAGFVAAANGESPLKVMLYWPQAHDYFYEILALIDKPDELDDYFREQRIKRYSEEFRQRQAAGLPIVP